LPFEHEGLSFLHEQLPFEHEGLSFFHEQLPFEHEGLLFRHEESTIMIMSTKVWIVVVSEP